MSQLPSSGDNRTTRAQHSDMYDEMEKGPEEFKPTSHGDARELLTQLRSEYAQASGPVGHVPAGEEDETMVELLDKLGERLAFERSGTRLYEGLLSKFDTWEPFEGGPEREDLEEIRKEEEEHFRMLKEVIADLGGDPAAITPSADMVATISRGVLDVISDPRTSLVQGLEAIMVAELADRASWNLLVDLAQGAGEDRLADVFENALRTEERHLEMVESWVRAALGLEIEED